VRGVRIVCRDLAGSERLYAPLLRALGFRRHMREPDAVVWHRRDEWLFLRQGVAAAPPTPFDPANPRAWYCLTADDRAQVESLYGRVRAAGLPILRDAQASSYPWGYYSFAFADPDGVAIEISCQWDDLPEVGGAERVSVPGDGVRLGGYLLVPLDSTGPAPALAMLHGFASNAWELLPAARMYAREGYVVLALSLRGWLGSEGLSDQGLRQPHDVAAAIRWLGARPEVDAARIGLLGFSLGGQVALSTAALKPPIRCVASYFAFVDYLRHASGGRPYGAANPALLDYLDDLNDPDPDAWRARSPLHAADRIDASVLLVHGDADENVPVEQSRAMAEALRALGKPVELQIMPGAGHFFDADERTRASQFARRFFARHLGGG
jgi:dienelactone hydrolase/catechol 2,3-dioxygenase-like lactoylglutathione lyase family enzyme